MVKKIMKKKYKAKKGSAIPNKKAQAYGERIETLMCNKGGEVKPHDIVEDAKKKTSVYHDYFEWDNSKAGEKFRLQQARHMLATVVEVVIIDKKKSEQRSFFNVHNEKKENVYVSLETAMVDKDYRAELLNKIINHLENTQVLMKLFMKKY